MDEEILTDHDKPTTTMKREIKFRGMSLNGDWHYGLLCVIKSGTRSHHKPGHYISNSVGIATAYPVRPDTVCQFTGLRDKNGKEIYDGDVVIGESHQRKPYAIVSDVGGLVVMEIGELACMKRGHYYLCEAVADHQTTGWLQNCEVIGNIHENPELLS